MFFRRKIKHKSIGFEGERGNSVSIVGNKVTINGREFIVPPGKNIKVVNQTIYVDGKVWSQEEDEPYLQPPFEVVWDGDIASLNVTGDVRCRNVLGNVSAGYDVHSGTIDGNVSAGRDVSGGDVSGNVSCGGNVSCSHVSGKISCGGNVNIKE